MKKVSCGWWPKALATVVEACLIGTVAVIFSYLKPPQPVMAIIMLAGFLSITTASAYSDMKADNLPAFIVGSSGVMVFLCSLRQLLYPDGNVNELVFFTIFFIGDIMAIASAFLIVKWAKSLRFPDGSMSGHTTIVVGIVEPDADNSENPDPTPAIDHG